MSCGDPHDTDCTEVLRQVWLFLDGEIDTTGRSTIQHHLDECSPCLREVGIEQEVKALVARSCGCDEVPTDLRDRVLARLREVSVRTDGSTVVVRTTETEIRGQ